MRVIIPLPSMPCAVHDAPKMMSKICWTHDRSDDVRVQYENLVSTVGLIDLDQRGRLCLTGADRASFLHGQITQDTRALAFGQGAFAALADAKGRIQADLTIYCLREELLLDFEPGMTSMVQQRLEHYLVSEDVTVLDPSSLYTLLSLQGPSSEPVLRDVLQDTEMPRQARDFIEVPGEQGPLYICCRPRCGSHGFDLFLPRSLADAMHAQLEAAVLSKGGCRVGPRALEMARIEAGVPRVPVDMGPDYLVQETGLESAVVSFSKGCYIGQEVISRIRSQGKLNKSLRRVVFHSIPEVTAECELTLYVGDKRVGVFTSGAVIPGKTPRALGFAYIKRDFLDPSTPLRCRDASGQDIDVRLLGEPVVL